MWLVSQSFNRSEPVRDSELNINTTSMLNTDWLKYIRSGDGEGDRTEKDTGINKYLKCMQVEDK